MFCTKESVVEVSGHRFKFKGVGALARYELLDSFQESQTSPKNGFAIAWRAKCKLVADHVISPELDYDELLNGEQGPVDQLYDAIADLSKLNTPVDEAVEDSRENFTQTEKNAPGSD